MVKEKIGLERLKEGTIVTIYFKEGYGRPTNGQRFRFLRLQGRLENMEKKDDYYVDGFVIIAQPIDLDGLELVEKGQALPQALFPHTIERLETDEEVN